MPRRKMKVCTVTGIETSEKNFYANQNHVKALKIKLSTVKKVSIYQLLLH